jgi:hypothetical protein
MARRSERMGREMDQFQANAQAFGAAQIPHRADETLEGLLAAARNGRRPMSPTRSARPGATTAIGAAEGLQSGRVDRVSWARWCR